MLEKSFGLFFFLKKPKIENEDGTRYVYLKITVDGDSKEISTKRLWQPSRWSREAGNAAGKKEDSKSLNSFLDSYKEKAYQAKKLLLDNDRNITAQAMKDILTGKGEDRKMIIDLFQYHNDKMKALIGKDFARGTHKRYETSLSHTRSFIQWKYKVDDLPIKNLDYDFITEYSFWFKSIRNCNQNTTAKYLGNFKKIVLECVKKKWLRSDPFAEFKLVKKEVFRRPLTAGELKVIESKKIEIERIAQVRDIFLFSCYTGLAYIDVKQLTRNQIAKGIDGAFWIFSNRQKTESATNIPLLPQAIKLLDKYKSHPQCIAENKLLPVLSNQKMNSYLKEIADLCGITKILTYHIARHTFATTVTLSNNVPIESVSKMLGHKSIKQTQQYAKVVDIKLSQDMTILKNKLLKEQ